MLPTGEINRNQQLEDNYGAFVAPCSNMEIPDLFFAHLLLPVLPEQAGNSRRVLVLPLGSIMEERLNEHPLCGPAC